MSSCRSAFAALVLAALALGAQAQGKYPGIGRAATPQEVAAWDIDVRADFKGLPAGSGSVRKGQQVWEDKCASCHGVFGESNQVFHPLIGGTTAQDIETGRVANLTRPEYPARTTLMKVATLSTLWDYINRAMPWNQPKSLTVEEVYAVTAYMLNLGGVLPDDFTLSDRNMADVQKRLPNRNGTRSAHALWPGRELGGTAKPDVTGTACMKDCAVEPKVASVLPAFARDAHGNLAEQNRLVGPQRGADTTRAEQLAPGAAAASAAPPAPVKSAAVAAAPSADGGKALQPLLQKNACTACHSPQAKLIGPSWADIASKHAGKADYLAGKIKAGGSGVWGAIAMPPQPGLAEADAKRIASWLAQGANP